MKHVSLVLKGLIWELAYEAVRDWVGETETFVDNCWQIRKLFKLGQAGAVIRVWDCGFELKKSCWRMAGLAEMWYVVPRRTCALYSCQYQIRTSVWLSALRCIRASSHQTELASSLSLAGFNSSASSLLSNSSWNTVLWVAVRYAVSWPLRIASTW